MARDKKRDDDNFNCGQSWELDLVSNNYPKNEQKVRNFLVEKCTDNTIKYSTHKEVYKLIEDKLGLPQPVAV